MAEQAQNAANAVKDAVQDVTDKVGELTTETAAEGAQTSLLLDEVTGERVSKTELKKRQKLREKEAKKAEKAATTAAAAPPPKAKKAGSAEEEEAKLNPNQYFEIRSRAIQKLRQSQEPNP